MLPSPGTSCRSLRHPTAPLQSFKWNATSRSRSPSPPSASARRSPASAPDRSNPAACKWQVSMRTPRRLAGAPTSRTSRPISATSALAALAGVFEDGGDPGRRLLDQRRELAHGLPEGRLPVGVTLGVADVEAHAREAESARQAEVAEDARHRRVADAALGRGEVHEQRALDQAPERRAR